MATPELPTFDELVDLLRVRLGDADALSPAELHSFKALMADHSDVIADQWHGDAFRELEAQGHLDDASALGNGGDLRATLSRRSPLPEVIDWRLGGRLGPQDAAGARCRDDDADQPPVVVEDPPGSTTSDPAETP